jgi:hypothetical protein
MATSGSVDFTMTAEKVIEKAFSKIGVKVAEQNLQSFEIQDGLDELNIMLKAWQGLGLHLWSKQEGVIFLDKGKTDYLLGATGDEATDLDDFISTTTDNAEIALAVVIEVASTTGMTALDTVGIALDSGIRHWTTIVSVDPGVSITITTGIPTVSAAENTVFTFTDLIKRPLRVIGARRKTFNVDSEIPVTQMSRFDYFNQPAKESQGTVVNYYYSPQLGNGRFYVWQTASSINDFVRITYERPIEDIDDKKNNLDIPVEWLQAVIYNLAARLADDYDAPVAKVQSVTSKAAVFLENILGWDEEPSSISIQPEFD